MESKITNQPPPPPLPNSEMEITFVVVRGWGRKKGKFEEGGQQASGYKGK